MKPPLVGGRTTACALGDVEHDAETCSLQLVSQHASGSHWQQRARAGVEFQRDDVDVELLVLQSGLFDRSGKILATRQVVTGGGYNSQRAAPVHFGLATLDPVRVDVTFMTAAGRKTQTIRDVKPAEFTGKSLVVRQDR